jgi:HAD superfamily hydrolase (TIGR01484 family)
VSIQIVKPPLAPRHSPDWIYEYAAATAAQKRILTGTADFEALHRAVQSAFRRVFRAVAFDIDGTLTKAGSHELEPAAAHAVAALLQRGVHVFLVTGRGEKSTTLAAEFIRDETRISPWYLRRLACVALNGVLFLAANSRGESFLAEAEKLVPDLPDHTSLIPALEGAVSNWEHVKVERKTHSVRIVVGSCALLDEVRRALEQVLDPWVKACPDLCLSSGKYGEIHSLSLSRSNKRIALESIAKRLGISADLILRIGDQGQEGGNDHELLDSSSGFSVGEISLSSHGCFPVFDDSFRTGMRAADATRRVTSQVNLLPSISLTSDWTEHNYGDLLTFEKLALSRSREENFTTTQRLQVKLRYLIGSSSSPQGLTTQFRQEDIFDPLSGAVRFRDWEFHELPSHLPATQFFTRQLDTAPNGARAPHLSWSMYTDTGRLLRGPNYYYALSRNSAASLDEYLFFIADLIEASEAAIDSLVSEQPTLGLFKLVLAYADNLRNSFIQLQHLAFLRDLSRPELNFTTTSKVYRGLLYPHTAQHFRILLNPDWEWRTGLQKYAQALSSIRTVFEKIRSMLLTRSKLEGSSIRAWRESDHFLQNVAAVQLGLHEFLQRGDLLQGSAVACGLVYGGTELPAIAAVVGQSRLLKISAAFAQLSIYGSREVGEKVRAGDNTYIEEFLLRENRVGIVGVATASGMPTVILDDNVTTGATLQLARDLIVVSGGDVVGAIVVGFPGANRSVQMQMDGHVDPDLLFGFVRGLVSPSPYARLLFPAAGANKWIDQTSVFNKARARIERYIQKNVDEGT